MTRKALGRGLEALIPRQLPELERGGAGSPARSPADALPAEGRVSIEKIRPNPWQPRKSVDPAKMEELVSSVRLRGILEPLLVRKVGETYELVAGERRLRAAQEAGLEEVPIIVVDLTDKESLEVALVENLQREDLNAIDEARAYQLLAEEFGRTHDEIARQVGKDRSTVTNLIRLLRLPPDLQDHVGEGRLSVGHARALLALTREPDQRLWAERTITKRWSVRDLERKLLESDPTVETGSKDRRDKSSARDPHHARVEDAIRRAVGASVKLQVRRKGDGRLEILFADQAELERILEMLGVQVH